MRVKAPFIAREKSIVRHALEESICLGLQIKVGGKFLLKLNIGKRPIANKYREGTMKRTLKRGLKLPEIVKREGLASSVPVLILFYVVFHMVGLLIWESVRVWSGLNVLEEGRVDSSACYNLRITDLDWTEVHCRALRPSGSAATWHR